MSVPKRTPVNPHQWPSWCSCSESRYEQLQGRPPWHFPHPWSEARSPAFAEHSSFWTIRGTHSLAGLAQTGPAVGEFALGCTVRISHVAGRPRAMTTWLLALTTMPGTCSGWLDFFVCGSPRYEAPRRNTLHRSRTLRCDGVELSLKTIPPK